MVNINQNANVSNQILFEESYSSVMSVIARNIAAFALIHSHSLQRIKQSFNFNTIQVSGLPTRQTFVT